MSLKALPLQFLNLGGEMMYIIDQRLQAQNVAKQRADKVRNDILSIMLSQRFVEELFHPQPLYSKSALRTVFDKLAHTSIMRLNAYSMDKLFDLMMMALKQQLILCPQPRDLLFITLNHLDAMYSLAVSGEVQKQVDITKDFFMQLQSKLSIGEWSDIRRSLLLFVQDLNIRVSIFLKTGVQDPLGRIVLPISGSVSEGCDVPGIIKFFDSTGKVCLMTLFPSGGSYTSPEEPGSLESRGIRGTTLGLNMYENRDDVPLHSSITYEDTNIDTCMYKPNLTKEHFGKGKEELNLLAQLIGSASHATSDVKEFKLNFFFNEDDEEISPIISDNVITIEGSVRENPPELGNIIGQLTIEESSKHENCEEDDLLDLLDSAS